MDWVAGMQGVLDYIEANLTDEIDYEKVAAVANSSSYHFQRVFGILCGYTLGEYIRNRRLSLAGAELQADGAKVIDVALKYGYDNPDSFARAFKAFHGVLPSQARDKSAKLRSFSRLVLKFSLEGGTTMNYRIEEKPEIILTGFKRHFTGTPENRYEQEHDFYVHSRVNQYLLKGVCGDRDNGYSVITNIGDDGFDFYIAQQLDEWWTENLAKGLGYDEKAKEFEKIVVPKQLFVICETERMRYPTNAITELRRKMVSEWLPSSGYQLADAPEIEVTHWYYKNGDETISQSRYIELWLPIEKA